ncbi:hypothetical protein BT96DRAFT_1006938 [Gymnopus androsaceus JB14]|uniref:Uncharacterized protein n=1 Tax=Gymnopus androsaceus JB14 TaxID=1447944 RepID=A0A6A4GJQ6_9AGAR|nr:hypothetical protein BT96DRAFT_1006938 [Gymnopus androsaceus JB14]
MDPSECISEPGAGQHHSSSLLGTRSFKAYRVSHALDYLQNDLDFAQPGLIYVVTHGTRVGFFPLLTIAQEFTLNVSSNAWKKCRDMDEAFDYYTCTYNEPARGVLGVQDDLVLVMHRNSGVTIEQEPADGNPHYPLNNLPAYTYCEALVRAVENQTQEAAASAPTPFAPSPGPIVILDIDSDSDGEYSFAYDLANLSGLGSFLTRYPPADVSHAS